jgi:hypothetical protein
MFFSLQGDIPAGKMLAGIPGIDPARRQRLIDVLDIDVDWKMHLVSDGQRRRVQLAMGLLKPFTVLLLDEITVDLDVLGRADLMKFLKEECDERGATIIYVSFVGYSGVLAVLCIPCLTLMKLFCCTTGYPYLRRTRLLAYPHSVRRGGRGSVL